MRGYWALAAVGSICAAILWTNFDRERLYARELAQRALFYEIGELLIERRGGQEPLPKRLADLPLTYPEGSDSSFLDLFYYEPRQGGFYLETIGVFHGLPYKVGRRSGHSQHQQ